MEAMGYSIVTVGTYWFRCAFNVVIYPKPGRKNSFMRYNTRSPEENM